MNPPANKRIDLTVLAADATRAQIEAAAREAVRLDVAALCVNNCWTRLVNDLLTGSAVAVCVSTGLPAGANTTLTKMFEADQAIEAGAREIEMLLNVGALKSGLHDFVKDDIAGVLSSCRKIRRKQALLKVIIEAPLLTDAEKRLACEIAKAAGAEFVVTHSGFNGGAASVEDIRLMRAAAGPDIGLKAAGAATRAEVEALLAAGATRIGAGSASAVDDSAGAR